MENRESTTSIYSISLCVLCAHSVFSVSDLNRYAISILKRRASGCYVGIDSGVVVKNTTGFRRQRGQNEIVTGGSMARDTGRLWFQTRKKGVIAMARNH